MCGASGALGSDQLVDSLAPVLQHEILIRRLFAVVDFLRPLFERKLYSEGFVDGKGDVEKVETVDLEIVDGVTLGLDIFTRNIASFRNDFSHFIECSGHRACSSGQKKRRPSPARASPFGSGPSIVNAPYSEGRRQVQRRRPPLKPVAPQRQARQFCLAVKGLSPLPGGAWPPSLDRSDLIVPAMLPN